MELLGDCPLEGEEFLFVGMIPLLGVIHNPTRISDRMVAPISLLLRKNSPEAFTRRVPSQGGTVYRSREKPKWGPEDRPP